MFGMVDKERAVAGRVFVTDAEIYEEDRRRRSMEMVNLDSQSLSSPSRPPFKCI